MQSTFKAKQMTQKRALLVVAGLLATFAAAPTALQQGPTGKPNQMTVVAVVGCVAQEGTNLYLTNASGPIVQPTADGKAQTGSGVTAEQAKAQPAGKERYRLINMLEEFGVASHKGHKVLVKGLIVGDAKERRINLVSLEMIAPTCAGR